MDDSEGLRVRKGDENSSAQKEHEVRSLQGNLVEISLGIQFD